MKLLVIILCWTLPTFCVGEEPNCEIRSNPSNPVNFKPFHYKLQLNIEVEKELNQFQFKDHKVPAMVTIYGHSLIPTHQIVLQAENLTINKTSLLVKSENGTGKEHIIQNTCQDDRLFVIYLKEKLMPLEKIVIYMEYFAEQMSEDGVHNGLWVTSRDELSDGAKFDSVVGLGANTIFPYFDKMESTFEVSIIRGENQTPVFNSPLLKTIQNDGNGLYKDDFMETPKLFPDQLNFAVLSDDYSFVESGFGDNKAKPLRIYAQKHILTDYNGTVRNVAEDVSRILTFYQKFYQDNDRFPKMDIVDTEKMGWLDGGRISWGISIDGAQLELKDYDNEKQSALAKNLGKLWQSELKEPMELNRAINEFVSESAVHSTNEKNVMKTTWTNYLYLRDLKTESPQNLNYKRIKVVLDMYADCFTSKTILNAAREYSRKTLDKENVTITDFFECLHEAVKNESNIVANVPTVNEIATTFTWEGFPIVKLSIFNATHVALAQEKFIAKRHIPIKILKVENSGIYSTSTVWLRPGETLLVEHDMSRVIMIDPNATGYYNVLYDTVLLQNIQRQLERDPTVFNPIARMKLLDNYFMFFKNKNVSIQTALNLTRYFGKEKDLFVWSLFWSENILPIYYKVYNYPDMLTVFQKYIGHLVEPHLNWTESGDKLEYNGCWSAGFGEPFVETESFDETSQFRRRLWEWACLAESPSCKTYVSGIFSRWNSSKMISPSCLNRAESNLKLDNSVECKLFEVGGKEAGQLALDIYRNSSDSTWLPFVGCTNDTQLIADVYNKMSASCSDTEPNYYSDSFTVLRKLSYFTPISNALNYLVCGGNSSSEHLDWLLQNAPERMYDLLRDLAEFGAAHPGQLERILSEEFLKRLTKEQKDHFKTVFTMMKESIGWMKENGDAILKWLKMQ